MGRGLSPLKLPQLLDLLAASGSAIVPAVAIPDVNEEVELLVDAVGSGGASPFSDGKRAVARRRAAGC